jgi:hypothetical protein
LAIAIPSVGEEGSSLSRIDRPSDHTPGEDIEDDREIYPALVRFGFPGGAMLSDIVDPQQIWSLSGEHPVDQIRRGRCLVTRPGTAVPRWPFDAGTGHQQLHPIVADGKPQFEGEFGVHPHDAVGAARSRVYGLDLFGQPSVAHRPLRGWPEPPFAIADWDTDSCQQAVGTGSPSAAMPCYGGVPPFGSRSRNSSRALFRIATAGLEFADAFVRCHQLGLLSPVDAGQLAALDELLLAPLCKWSGR